jgi:predicted ATP-grasp superfamily ATP-dependent carboligase
MNINVFVYPCSSGIGQEIYKSLSDNKEITLYGGNSSDISQGKFLYENYIFDIPLMSDIENFIITINCYIEKYKIDVIIPTYDDATVIFTEIQEKLHKNVKIITSSSKTCKICRSKKETYDLLCNIVKCPIIYNDTNLDDDKLYPLFIKPTKGCGSINSYKINNKKEITSDINIENNILCEYLSGIEYTVDCFTNNKKLLFCRPRERLRTINGISVLTKSIEDNAFKNECYEFAKKINDTIEFIGAWFFQVKYDKNNILTLLEIAPRIAGAMNLYRPLGINFILLSIYTHLNIPVFLELNKIENLVCHKIYSNYYLSSICYENIYVDYDDTLIIKNKINHRLLGFLYKEKTKKKNIYLITKHDGNIYENMEYYYINKNLFNDIYHIAKDEHKKDLIFTNSIFIDDSFKERLQVLNQNKENIYAFDLDNIEYLYNNINEK